MTNNLTAGHEPDAAVANACGIKFSLMNGKVCRPDPGGLRLLVPFSPSTDLNAAFEAAEKCGLLTYTTHLGSHSPEMVKYEGGYRWYVERSHETQHGGDSEVIGRGETPALAICRAILALHGDKETR